MRKMKWALVASVMALAVLTMVFSYVGCGGGGSSSSGSSGSGATTYSISGAITGSVLSDLTIKLSGVVTGSTSTNTSGQYSFSGLANGLYSVTAEKGGHLLQPFGKMIYVNGASVSGVDFTATSSGVAKYLVSGTVTGTSSAFARCVMTIGGPGGTGQVMTDKNGYYAFNAIPAGSYGITPSNVACNFSPMSSFVAVSGASSGNDFTLNNRTIDISGTITYTGIATGQVYVRLINVGGGDTDFGTCISPVGSYVIRGVNVSDGNYQVQAFMDILGYGIENTSAPSGTSTTIVMASGALTNVSGKNITLTDPVSVGSVISPTGLFAAPGDGCAMVVWDVTENVSGTETAQSYNLYWSTSGNVSKSVYDGAALNIPAHDDGHYLQRGLTNAAVISYVVTANIGGTESAESEVYTTTIGAPVGGITVTGTVTFPSTAGKLYIGLYSETGLFITSTNLATAATSKTYTMTGVTPGSYQAFAIFDLDSNGHITLGDITNTNDTAQSVVITSTDKTINQTLSNANAGFDIDTNHQNSDQASEHYYLNVSVREGVKRPVKVTVNSGPFITGPTDITKDWSFGTYYYFTCIRPRVGDTYQITVVYSDGTSQNLSAGVTAVMDNFALNLAATSSLTPTLSWDPPTVEPASYSYSIRVEDDATGAEMWDYPNNDANMPSDQLSVVYDVDGNATALSAATDYRMIVTVKDANGNAASYSKVFTTP